MITKAIIEQKVNNYEFKVRMPYYNRSADSPNATKTDDLYTATVCCMPNNDMNYQIGDIVFLAFEDNKINSPVILGQLFRESKTDSNPELVCNSINSSVDAFLPECTYIGEVGPTELQQLKGIKENIQFKLKILEDRIAKLEEGQ